MLEVIYQKDNMCRIKKDAKYDLCETYQILKQHFNQQDHAHQINNIFVLKNFEVQVIMHKFGDEHPCFNEKMKFQHCCENDLGRRLGLKIKDIQYSEDGKVFLLPSRRQAFMYQNLRAGNFNTVHLLIE